jgi:tetraacyldisaccharide 4'-kinase
VPVFRSDHRPYISGIVPAGRRELDGAAPARAACSLEGLPLVAFCGIARNGDFLGTLARFGANIVKSLAYPDHHPYSETDLNRIRRVAGQTGARGLVTTEKDFVRIQSRLDWPLPLVVIGVGIDFGDQTETFSGFIRRRTAGIFSGGG